VPRIAAGAAILATSFPVLSGLSERALVTAAGLAGASAASSPAARNATATAKPIRRTVDAIAIILASPPGFAMLTIVGSGAAAEGSGS